MGYYLCSKRMQTLSTFYLYNTNTSFATISLEMVVR